MATRTAAPKGQGFTPTQRSEIAAMIASAVAEAFEIATAPKVQSTGKASESVAVMVGKPTIDDTYFSPEQLAEGEGYSCQHGKNPCQRLLAGPNRTSSHRWQDGGHKPQF